MFATAIFSCSSGASSLLSDKSVCLSDSTSFPRGGKERREGIDCLCQGSDTNLFSWWKMIDAQANFKLCELNSPLQRQRRVNGAQLEGPDKTCSHLRYYTMYLSWPFDFDTHNKMFNCDYDWIESGVWVLTMSDRLLIQMFLNLIRDVRSSCWIEQVIKLKVTHKKNLDVMFCIKGNQIKYKGKQNPASLFGWGLLSDTRAGWLSYSPSLHAGAWNICAIEMNVYS